MRWRVIGGDWARDKDWLRAQASPMSYRHSFLVLSFFSVCISVRIFYSLGQYLSDMFNIDYTVYSSKVSNLY